MVSYFRYNPARSASPFRRLCEVTRGVSRTIVRLGLEMEGSMRLCLVEDNAVAGLEPLTLTRPTFDLLLGASTLGEKAARAFSVGPGPRRRGVVIRPYLAAVQQARDPQTAVNDRDWLARGPVLVVNAR